MKFKTDFNQSQLVYLILPANSQSNNFRKCLTSCSPFGIFDFIAKDNCEFAGKIGESKIMKTNVYADIETLPPSEADREQMNTQLINKLLKRKSAKTEADGGTEAVTVSDELFGKLGLHAEYGRVLAIGIVVEQNGEITRQGVFGFDTETGTFHGDEAKTLRGFGRC
jgi:hypothetical protein